MLPKPFDEVTWVKLKYAMSEEIVRDDKKSHLHLHLHPIFMTLYQINRRRGQSIHFVSIFFLLFFLCFVIVAVAVVVVIVLAVVIVVVVVVVAVVVVVVVVLFVFCCFFFFIVCLFWSSIWCHDLGSFSPYICAKLLIKL